MSKLKELKSKIQEQFPIIEFKDESYVDDLTLTFENKFQKEYYFQIIVSKSFRFVNICANLRNQPKNQYFWQTEIDYITKEYGNEELFLEFIIETLEILTKHRTRIIQEKRLLSQVFTLEYFSENSWKKLNQKNAFRYSNFIFPTIVGKRMIYE